MFAGRGNAATNPASSDFSLCHRCYIRARSFLVIEGRSFPFDAGCGNSAHWIEVLCCSSRRPKAAIRVIPENVSCWRLNGCARRFRPLHRQAIGRLALREIAEDAMLGSWVVKDFGAVLRKSPHCPSIWCPPHIHPGGHLPNHAGNVSSSTCHMRVSDKFTHPIWPQGFVISKFKFHKKPLLLRLLHAELMRHHDWGKLKMLVDQGAIPNILASTRTACPNELDKTSAHRLFAVVRID